MGRTLPTIIQLIHKEQDLWKPYRRALRQEDREIFDTLWRSVRHFAVSAQMSNRPIYFEALLVSMLMGVLKEMRSGRPILEPPKEDSSHEDPPGLDL